MPTATTYYLPNRNELLPSSLRHSLFLRFFVLLSLFVIDPVSHLECQQALGMENNEIPHGQISASSQLSADHAAFLARLNFEGGTGGWRAGTSDSNQWLEVDLGSLYTKVTGAATQGRHSVNYLHRVTKYKLQYSDAGVNFQTYKEHGQSTDKVCCMI